MTAGRSAAAAGTDAVQHAGLPLAGGLALAASSFAGGVWIVALVWEVIRLDGGPGQLSTVMTASAVGVLIPALLAGVVADRVPQKLILLAVALVELVAMTLVAFLSSVDLNAVWMLASVTFVTGMGMAFYYPAYSAWLPALIPESDLQAVNGFEGMVRPLIGSGHRTRRGRCRGRRRLTRVRVHRRRRVVGCRVRRAGQGPAAPRSAAPSTMPTLLHPLRTAFADMREGFVYMVRTPWLLATLLFASLMILVMMGPLEVLIPFLVKDSSAAVPTSTPTSWPPSASAAPSGRWRWRRSRCPGATSR